MRIVALGAIALIAILQIISFKTTNKKQAGTTARVLAEQAYKQIQREHPDQPPAPEIVLRDTDLYLFGNDDIKGCLIKAQESKVFPNDQQMYCSKIICNLTTNKNEVVTLHAPQAIINYQAKNVLFPGIIKGYFKEWRLEKQNASYNSNTHTIKAGPTKLISQNGISIAAQESIIDLKHEIVTLNRNVVSLFQK